MFNYVNRVAKNRIVDHYLQTLKLPREYIQLHRKSNFRNHLEEKFSS